MNWSIVVFCLALSHPLFAFFKYGFRYLTERKMHSSIRQVLVERINQDELMRMIEKRLNLQYSEETEVMNDGKITGTDPLQTSRAQNHKKPL